ncbi:Transglycosylase SLT domain-containing protein [Mariniphaga anaerophila]|uniref:Transglycosylase SLT domain-containing protein n=1 Tax=Mariniphaga anaerophila TaxID=1484053 RepID=A0A1M4XWF4_9BACT|nr:lytic transglycosylase domain-containing protein [Mariniphaga anaerophila]SHE97924.1 Transglycosylase SLT domain-containing protein [Mariniphaga anaerophila]
MNSKKWVSFLLPVLLVINAGIVIFLVMGSSTSETSEGGWENAPAAFHAVEVPDSVTFAGEPVPLWRFDVRESLDRELLVNSYFHSQTIRYIKLAPRYFSIIEPILKEKGVPDDFKFLAVAESGFNPSAVSPARAVGLWQFLQGTGRDYGLEIGKEVDERYHVEKSTYAACDYLLDSYERFGSWSMVAAAYNAGNTGVKRQITRQKTESYYDLLFGSEPSRYVFRIIALKLIMENPEKYNFAVPEEEKYPVVSTREVEITGKVEDFADFALEQGINYKLLKNFNPWLRDNFLTNSARKTYTVQIPVIEEKD